MQYSFTKRIKDNIDKPQTVLGYKIPFRMFGFFIGILAIFSLNNAITMLTVNKELAIFALLVSLGALLISYHYLKKPD